MRKHLRPFGLTSPKWRPRLTLGVLGQWQLGGFLGAAAAVSLWGLSQQAARFSGFVVWVAGAAALFYVLAVIGFLAASVLPTPKPDPNVSGTIADQMHAFAHKETKPIKWFVLVSAGLGSLAIAATTLGSFLVLLSPIHSREMVSFADENRRWATLQRLCPAIPDPFFASVTDDGSDLLRMRVLGAHCGKHRPELVVPRNAVLRLEQAPS